MKVSVVTVPVEPEIFWTKETAGEVRWVQETNTRQYLEQLWTIHGIDIDKNGYAVKCEKTEWRKVRSASPAKSVQEDGG